MQKSPQYDKLFKHKVLLGSCFCVCVFLYIVTKQKIFIGLSIITTGIFVGQWAWIGIHDKVTAQWTEGIEFRGFSPVVTGRWAIFTGIIYAILALFLFVVGLSCIIPYF